MAGVHRELRLGRPDLSRRRRVRACAAVGNGRNDAPMLGAVALGIAVIGPEGAHRDALAAADITALSIDEALALLAEPKTLKATLRR